MARHNDSGSGQETYLRKLPQASPRLTLRRSLSGGWAVGWGPRCPEEAMVTDLGPAGCPAAPPKSGGLGAVAAAEVQMTWLT